MSSNLATIVRGLHSGRARTRASNLKVASVASEAVVDRRSRSDVAPASPGESPSARLSVARFIREKPDSRLPETTIKFVGHHSFDDSSMIAEILGPLPGSAERVRAFRRGRKSKEPDAHGGESLEKTILTHEQEAHLFRKFNFLKFQAAKLRAKIDVGDDKPADREQVVRLLADASAIRNRLVRCYLRLVVSIVRSWIRPGEDFLELLSEGSVTMMRAIECFDFARGRRFSTYVTWAVTNDFARTLPRERNRRRRFKTGRDGLLQLVSDHRGSLPDAEHRDPDREEIEALLDRLSDREHVVIDGRFGLTGDKQTLDEIGYRLGISKERVRQIESRALGKLRRFAKARERNPAGGCQKPSDTRNQ
jgi:RNA polymerase primary sigma factor